MGQLESHAPFEVCGLVAGPLGAAEDGAPVRNYGCAAHSPRVANAPNGLARVRTTAFTILHAVVSLRFFWRQRLRSSTATPALVPSAIGGPTRTAKTALQPLCSKSHVDRLIYVRNANCLACGNSEISGDQQRS